MFENWEKENAEFVEFMNLIDESITDEDMVASQMHRVLDEIHTQHTRTVHGCYYFDGADYVGLGC